MCTINMVCYMQAGATGQTRRLTIRKLLLTAEHMGIVFGPCLWISPCMLLQMPVMWVAQLQMEMLACSEPASSCLLVSRSATKVCDLA